MGAESVCVCGMLTELHPTSRSQWWAAQGVSFTCPSLLLGSSTGLQYTSQGTLQRSVCLLLDGAKVSIQSTFTHTHTHSLSAPIRSVHQEDLVVNLKQALTRDSIPEITQTILNLAEFMEHCEEATVSVWPNDAQALLQLPMVLKQRALYVLWLSELMRWYMTEPSLTTLSPSYYSRCTSYPGSSSTWCWAAGWVCYELQSLR